MATPAGEPDLLYGIDDIASALGMTRRQAYYLHEKGEIPTFKVGRKLAARRSTLDELVKQWEAAGRADGGAR